MGAHEAAMRSEPVSVARARPEWKERVDPGWSFRVNVGVDPVVNVAVDFVNQIFEHGFQMSCFWQRYSNQESQSHLMSTLRILPPSI